MSGTIQCKRNECTGPGPVMCILLQVHRVVRASLFRRSFVLPGLFCVRPCRRCSIVNHSLVIASVSSCSFCNPWAPRRVRCCVVISFVPRMKTALFVHAFSGTDYFFSRLVPYCVHPRRVDFVAFVVIVAATSVRMCSFRSCRVRMAVLRRSSFVNPSLLPRALRDIVLSFLTCGGCVCRLFPVEFVLGWVVSNRASLRDFVGKVHNS